MVNFSKTSHGCSLYDALTKLFKELDTYQKSGCYGNLKQKKMKSLRISFSETDKPFVLCLWPYLLALYKKRVLKIMILESKLAWFSFDYIEQSEKDISYTTGRF